MFAEIIPAQVATSLGGVAAPAGQSLPTVDVKLRPVYSHSGSTATGPWANFPVSICSGCLNGCPTMAGTVGDGCFPQQDFINTCCASTGMLVCP